MDVNEIILLIDRLEKSTIGEFYLREDEFELNIIKNNPEDSVQTIIKEVSPSQLQQPAPSAAAQPIAPGTADVIPADNEVTVKSPLVGIYYESPTPDAPPFKKIGDYVKEGEVICILEAMKVFNEIKSPCEGKVKSVMVANQDIVEFDQPIMVIERTK
ncbi:acetyl-CoA carboxylase biotin carboxyl carrier protein [Alkalibacter saccharofermentans]|uniref:Biotin carboxyl carrier protein of acetyl-CoA carboxylase n=1 Tax=Alkalibacter saccharofermentans DSM 14828 TaxID=1120975 RepID=A0A1M4VWP1_9FIRM|nr:acetyl-CoA carboxylase biotin carboxyl carrier protein [Alkalibacter saccharofermentans]SHE73335.1 acetyl-CoA carboxylase biotin carboxyl carrier protein [Alkalibacter saccharofermentans DSM 14828]